MKEGIRKNKEENNNRWGREQITVPKAQNSNDKDVFMYFSEKKYSV